MKFGIIIAIKLWHCLYSELEINSKAIEKGFINLETCGRHILHNTS